MQLFNKKLIFLLLVFPFILHAVNVSVIPPQLLETSEGGANITFQVGLDSSPDSNVTVYCATSDLSEAKCINNSQLFLKEQYDILLNQYTYNFIIQPVDDTQFDGDINYTVTFSVDQQIASDDDEPMATDPLTSQTFSLVNHDNEISELQRVIITDTSISTSEDGAIDNFTISLDQKPTANVTMPINSSDTSEGVLITNSPLIFTPQNWDTPQKVYIQGVDDANEDGNIAYSINFGALSSSDTYYNGYAIDALNATNIDNDGASISPAIIITTPNGTETSENNTSIQLKISLNQAPTGNITVNFSGLNTQVDISEFDWPAAFNYNEVLTFSDSNWSTPQTVVMTGLDDAQYDGNISGIFTATDPSSTYSQATLTLTNVDNEPPAPNMTISVSDYSTSENGDTSTISVVLNQSPTAPVTLNFTSMKPDQGTVSPSTLVFDNTNWDTSQLVTVSAVDDSILDFTTNYEIRITSTSTDPAFIIPFIIAYDPTTSYIPYQFYSLDNESVATITLNDINASDSNYQATFSVVLDHETNSEVRIYPTVNNANELYFISPTTEYLVFTPENWNVPQTVIVSGENDSSNLQIENHSINFRLETRNDSDYNSNTIYHSLNMGDYSPNLFNFTDLSTQNFNSEIISAPVTISGLNQETNISISGTNCFYNINDGNYLNSNATITNEQNITLKTTTPLTIGESVTCTLNIGALSDEWTITNILKINLFNIDLTAKNITNIYLVDSSSFNGTLTAGNSIEISNAAISLANGITSFDLLSAFPSYLVIFVTDSGTSYETKWIYNKNNNKLYSLDNYTTSTQSAFDLNSSSDSNISTNLTAIYWINTSGFQVEETTHNYYIPPLEFTISSSDFTNATAMEVNGNSFYNLTSYLDISNTRYHEIHKMITEQDEFLNTNIKISINNLITSLTSTKNEFNDTSNIFTLTQDSTPMTEIKLHKKLDNSELETLHSQYVQNLNFNINYPEDSKGYELYTKQINTQCYITENDYFSDLNYTSLIDMTQGSSIIEYNIYDQDKGLKFSNDNLNNIYELTYSNQTQETVGSWEELTNIQCKNSNDTNFTSSSVIAISLFDEIDGYKDVALIKNSNGQYVKGIFIPKDRTKKQYLMNKEAIQYLSTNLNISNPLTLKYPLTYNWTYLSFPSNLTLCISSYQNLASCSQDFTVESIFANELETNPISVFKYRGGYWSNYSTDHSKTYNMDRLTSINHTDGLLIYTKNQRTLSFPYDIYNLHTDTFKIYSSGWHLIGNLVNKTPADLEAEVANQGKTLKYIMKQSSYNNDASLTWEVSAPTNDSDVDSSLNRINTILPTEAIWIYVE